MLIYIFYRSTPLHNRFSLGELLMGQELRTTLPVLSSQLEPSTPDCGQLLQKESEYRARQKQNYDSHHHSRELIHLLPGDTVYISDGNISTKGQVASATSSPKIFSSEYPSWIFTKKSETFTFTT